MNITDDQRKQAAVAHYDAHAPAMQNLDFFYDWVSALAQNYLPQRSHAICDVGCGTGALLARFRDQGYSRLHGVDFSPGCLALAQDRVPQATIMRHDIEEAPLPQRYDALFMTTVLDFLAQPQVALANLRQSLATEGLLFVTIRNRWAYWPWYHLRHLAPSLRRQQRLHHWFLWFTTPLGMRRADQPFERTYSPSQARAMIRAAGFRPIAETGTMALPMLWIPSAPWLTACAQAIDRMTQALPGNYRYYQYMFICRSGQKVSP